MPILKYDVVVAIDSVEKAIPAVESLLKLPAAERPSAIYVSVGRSPSTQRNHGLDKCGSPLVYFLDEDSWVIPGTPTLLTSHFHGERTAAAGGPNLPFPNASPFEKTVSSVLASWMGSFKVRYRYASIGSVKEATEKDLILCNMMVKRATFQEEGGFREHLYPNEENEFLNRLLHGGFQLIYDPAAAVYRPRRKTLWDFCYQAFRYGGGRARQMKVYPCLSDIVHLVPAFFLLYLASLAFPWIVTIGPFWEQSQLEVLLKSPLWWTPLGIFLLGALATGISASSWHRNLMDIFNVPALIFLRHSFYGLGLIRGFFSLTSKPTVSVKVFRVSGSGKNVKFIPIPSGSKK